MKIQQKSVMMGWGFIALGCIMIISAIDIIFKLLLIFGGLGLIVYGFSLKGTNTRFLLQRLFMRFF